MFKKTLRFIGQGTANTLEGLLQDLTFGKKARRGRHGAFKVRKQRQEYRRSYGYKTVVVYNYGTINV